MSDIQLFMTGFCDQREMLINKCLTLFASPFTPQAGHEQAGRRLALVLSPASYNGKVGLAILCPITSQVKGYPFEVATPAGSRVSGAILADQVKSLDWRVRQAEFICKLPRETTVEVLEKLGAPLFDAS